MITATIDIAIISLGGALCINWLGHWARS